MCRRLHRQCSGISGATLVRCALQRVPRLDARSNRLLHLGLQVDAAMNIPLASRFHIAFGRLAVAFALGAATCIVPSTVRADVIDITWFLTRVGGWRQSPLRAVTAVVVLMAINYAVNLIVIAVPVVKAGFPPSRAARDLIGFTLIAQVLDRIGMLLCSGLIVLLGFTVERVGGASAGAAVAAIVGLNFISSGVLIGFLARYYLARRWGMPKRLTGIVAVAAALFTNPAWMVATAGVPFFGPADSNGAHMAPRVSS
jgi:hypothetical protein